VAAAIGLEGKSIDQAVELFANIYKCYMDTDASLVEINPLNCDSKGDLMALDAKFNFDSNALFRHPKSWPCATWTKKTQKSKPPSSTWPTSRWTATSAAW
jgi:Succinyl-CoA synthetase, beta subunit